jgi:TRAP-type C4-dicarboxylate transport system permease small subunit
MSKSDAKKWRDLGDVGAVGIEFVLSLAFGYYAGRWLDRRFFGDRGWVTAAGAIFGVLAAFKAIYEAAKRAQRRLEELEREEREQASKAPPAADAPPPERNRDEPPRDDRPAG